MSIQRHPKLTPEEYLIHESYLIEKADPIVKLWGVDFKGAQLSAKC